MKIALKVLAASSLLLSLSGSGIALAGSSCTACAMPAQTPWDLEYARLSQPQKLEVMGAIRTFMVDYEREHPEDSASSSERFELLFAALESLHSALIADAEAKNGDACFKAGRLGTRRGRVCELKGEAKDKFNSCGKVAGGKPQIRCDEVVFGGKCIDSLPWADRSVRCQKAAADYTPTDSAQFDKAIAGLKALCKEGSTQGACGALTSQLAAVKANQDKSKSGSQYADSNPFFKYEGCSYEGEKPKPTEVYRQSCGEGQATVRRVCVAKLVSDGKCRKKFRSVGAVQVKNQNVPSTAKVEDFSDTFNNPNGQVRCFAKDKECPSADDCATDLRLVDPNDFRDYYGSSAEMKPVDVTVKP